MVGKQTEGCILFIWKEQVILNQVPKCWNLLRQKREVRTFSADRSRGHKAQGTAKNSGTHTHSCAALCAGHKCEARNYCSHFAIGEKTRLRIIAIQHKWRETRSSKMSPNRWIKPTLKPDLPTEFLVPWASKSLVYGVSQLELSFLLLVIKSILRQKWSEWSRRFIPSKIDL